MSRTKTASIIGLLVAVVAVALVFARINYDLETKWERQVAGLAANATNVSIQFDHGDQTSIPIDSWRIIQKELQLLTPTEVVSKSRGAAKSWAAAETATPSSQDDFVSSIVIELDGKHLTIDWDRKTVNFNRTWAMSTALIRSVENLLPAPGG